MAQRRMFSPQIVSSEEFLTMPVSSRELYFQLGMQADDDGFIQPKLIMKLTGATDDDLKVLLAKRFLLSFDGGVVVIKHWLIHNLIQKDRYHPTRFQDQKNTLLIKENKAYTEISNPVNKMLTEVRLGKVRLGEVNAEPSSADIVLLLDMFSLMNPAVKRMYGNTTQRKACRHLIDTYGLERTKKIITETLPKTNGLEFFPTITTPLQLQDKYIALESAIKRYQSENKKIKSSVAF